jgi:hypothetical protein
LDGNKEGRIRNATFGVGLGNRVPTIPEWLHARRELDAERKGTYIEDGEPKMHG